MNTKKAPALAGTLILIAAVSGCGGGADAEAWFSENCEPLVADVRETFTQGAPAGDVVGQAFIQGPLTPPADLDESPQSIGLYTYDELSGTMTQEGEVASGDLFCMEQSIDDEDRGETVDAPNIEGEITVEGYNADFTMLRSPDYPEGIWVGIHSSEIPKGIAQEDEMTTECALGWWPATDVADFQNAAAADTELGSGVEGSENC